MKVENGQPIKYKKDTLYFEVCCDCQLVHAVSFNKEVIMTAYRDDYETDKARKRKKRQKT